MRLPEGGGELVIVPMGAGEYAVSDGLAHHVVTLARGEYSCDCGSRSRCAHIVAVDVYRGATKGVFVPTLMRPYDPDLEDDRPRWRD